MSVKKMTDIWFNMGKIYVFFPSLSGKWIRKINSWLAKRGILRASNLVPFFGILYSYNFLPVCLQYLNIFNAMKFPYLTYKRTDESEEKNKCCCRWASLIQHDFFALVLFWWVMWQKKRLKMGALTEKRGEIQIKNTASFKKNLLLRDFAQVQ